MGLSRRQFLTSTTLLGAAVVSGCTTTVRGKARPNPADLSEVNARPVLPDQVEMVVIPYEPYTVEDGDELSGPVPDVARRVLSDLGVSEVRFTTNRDQAVVPAMVLAGHVQMAGGLAVRPDLCDAVAFSEPDYVSGTAFAVPAGNPKGLTTYADVIAKGAKLAVWRDLPEDQDAVAAGVPDANLVRLSDPIQLLDAVESGGADCFAFDDLSLRHLAKQFATGVEVADPFMPENRLPLVGAYAFPQDSELLEPFNEALRALHESGEWLDMVRPFGLTENNAPPADLTIDKACAG